MMTGQSAAQFAGEARIHIGLVVTDLGSAVAFYEQLLGASPVKQRPGYAKFEPTEPSVNLSLNEVASPQDPSSAGGATTHYGIQVKSTAAVQQAATRLQAAGIAVREELGTSCCYAGQDKIWVADPDGHRWEVFVVTQADVAPGSSNPSACCAGGSCETPELTAIQLNH